MNKQGLTFFNLDITGATLSMVALLTIAIIILSDQKIKAHPNQMIAYVFLCDAYLFCQFLTRYLVCGFGGLNPYFSYLYAITVQYPWVKLSCNAKGGEAAT